MIINSTELQNNFGKYLMLAAQEDIIITRNGVEIAKLSGIREGDGAGAFVRERAGKLSGSGWEATYEEFLELTKDSEKRYEYIDGEIYLLSSPKTAHQVILTELFVVFHKWFQGKQCTPMVAPYDITLKRNSKNINIVQPDIMIICDLEEKLGEDDYYMGVPDLVVEIVSKSTQSLDLINKLDLYMTCGVREYWIVNPINKMVTVYQFKDKNISKHFTFRESEDAESYIFPGLRVKLNEIFK